MSSMDSQDHLTSKVISAENARIFQKLFDVSTKQWEFYCKFRKARIEGACVSYIKTKIETEKDRSLLQRNLQALLKSQLVKRRKMTLAEYQAECRKTDITNLETSYDRGSLYFYIPLSDQELIELAKNKLRQWDLALNQILEEI